MACLPPNRYFRNRQAFAARGDAVVFVSHKQHCVAPVVGGLREVPSTAWCSGTEGAGP